MPGDGIMKRAGKILEQIIRPVAFLLYLALLVWRLLPWRKQVRQADVILALSYIGPGDSVVTIDAARRLFRGRRCLCLIISGNRYFNRRIAGIWPGIEVVVLPHNLINRTFERFDHLHSPRSFEKYGYRLLFSFLRRFARPEAVIIPAPGTPYRHSLEAARAELTRMTPVSEQEREVMRTLIEPNRFLTYSFHLGHNRLIDTIPAPRLRMNDQDRSQIHARLRRFLPTDLPVGPRLCCLYLRTKYQHVGGQAVPDIRCGSPLSDYLPALRLLRDSGYQVMLTGDTRIDGETFKEFHGWFVDYERLGIDRERYHIFAATEADVVVAEPGGGLHFSNICGIPMLIVNAYPYMLALPNTWLCFKTFREQATGRLVPFELIFREHAFAAKVPAGLAIELNSSETIVAALQGFLKDVQSKDSPDPYADLVAKLPAHLWIRHTTARLSPAWVELFEVQTGSASATTL